jgi:DNA-binding NarL/FixJ family response regulator
LPFVRLVVDKRRMTIRVFLVEDNSLIRESVSEALEELAPVQVVGFAATEDAAVEWLNENRNRCDLVVVDIFLERGSGLGVLRECANPISVDAVVLSNYVTIEMKRKCRDLGARRVFDKSTEIEDLIEFCSRLDSGEAL